MRISDWSSDVCSSDLFWGHNAILRTRAFAQSCGLPELPGREPFGGHIMSHDMVEAALLRRRGWDVHLVMADASFVEFPPSLPVLVTRVCPSFNGHIHPVPLSLSSQGHPPVNQH